MRTYRKELMWHHFSLEAAYTTGSLVSKNVAFALVRGTLGKKIQTKGEGEKRKYFFLVEFIKVLRSKESIQIIGKL